MKKHYKQHVKLDTASSGLDEAHEMIAAALCRKFGSSERPVLVAVGGPGGTGKTTFAQRLAVALEQAVVLPLDDYKTSREDRAAKNIYGPHPDANEMSLLKAHLAALRRGQTIQKPVYCRQAGAIQKREAFQPDRFVIVEGEIATYPDFHDQIDFSIFIDSHWKTQLNTRIVRDIEQRGYTPQKAIAAFLYSNLHEFSEYGMESKNWVDVHIHCDAQYLMVIDGVCSKSFAFMVDDVSQVLVEALPGVLHDDASDK